MSIKQEFVNQYPSCKRPNKSSKCNLQGVSQPIVLNVDCVFEQSPRGGNRCDEFIFCEPYHNVTGMYLVEVKDNKSNDVEKVRKQLQGGADFIHYFIQKDPALAIYKYDFRAIWVSQGIRPSLRNKLVGITISLYNEKRSIHHCKKKDKLPKI